MGTEHELKAAGLKATRQRKRIFETLRAADAPVTAEEIYKRVREDCQGLNISTVYRTLLTFCEKDLASKVSIEGKQAMFERKSGHRHYVVCVSCDRIVGVSSCALSDYEQSVERETGFRVKWHKLDIFGVCPDCGKHENSPFR